MVDGGAAAGGEAEREGSGAARGSGSGAPLPIWSSGGAAQGGEQPVRQPTNETFFHRRPLKLVPRVNYQKQ